MFNIKWDKNIEMTAQLFFMVVVSWFISGLIIGILLGLLE